MLAQRKQPILFLINPNYLLDCIFILKINYYSYIELNKNELFCLPLKNNS